MPGYHTDDTRIEQGDELLAPMQIMRELKASETALRTTYLARTRIHDVLRGADDRLASCTGWDVGTKAPINMLTPQITVAIR